MEIRTMTAKDIISILMALAVLIALIGSLWGRIQQQKGIGWQFIRFNTIAIALPITAILILNDLFTEGAAAILAGALGYAFGRNGGDE
jgi:hypothetical protein